MEPGAKQQRRRRRRNDLDLYERHADSWWNADSRAFRSLHRVNAFRVELLRDWLGERLPGALAIDLGCGGGLLAAPLAALGARVVGLDLGARSVAAAVDGARHPRCAFVRADVLHPPLRAGLADLVLLADVLEHLERQPEALRAAARLLRPGGLLYVNTINRTLRARVLAVHLAEGLGLVPRCTHDARLFVRPDELERMAADAGLRLVRVQGESPALAATLARWAIQPERSRSVALAYSALFELPAAAELQARRARAPAAEALP